MLQKTMSNRIGIGTYLNTLNNDPIHPASSQISELMDLRPLVYPQAPGYPKMLGGSYGM